MSRIVGAFGNSVLLEISEMGWWGNRLPAGPMEIRRPVTYRIVRLSDGEIVFEGTRPGQEQWALREVYNDAGNLASSWQPVVFGRTAVSAVTNRYAYLADTDSITITRYDAAGTPVEVVSFEQPRDSAQAEWVRFVGDTLRANEFRSERLLEDLPARPTLPAFSAMKGGCRGLRVDPGVTPITLQEVGGLGRIHRGVGAEEADHGAGGAWVGHCGGSLYVASRRRVPLTRSWSRSTRSLMAAGVRQEFVDNLGRAPRAAKRPAGRGLRRRVGMRRYRPKGQRRAKPPGVYFQEPAPES